MILKPDFDIEDFIQSLPWKTATDYEKTLVAGNLRNLYSKMVEVNEHEGSMGFYQGLLTVADQMKAIPAGAEYYANRYDTDDTHVIHIWSNKGNSFDIQVPREHALHDARKHPEHDAERVRILREALDMAKSGLTWWFDRNPLQVEECDHDAMKEIDAALEQTK